MNLKTFMKLLLAVAVSGASTYALANTYVFRVPISGVVASTTEGSVTPEDPVAPEETSALCYDPASIGDIGTEPGCNGMLIVDNAMLSSAASPNARPAGGNSSFAIYHADSGRTFTFGDSAYNVFTGQVTTMNRYFLSTSFNENIGYWDTGQVTDMSLMFSGAQQFNSNISNWNTANVTNMDSMFNNAYRFNSDISNWDTAKVTNMVFMFASAADFNRDLSSWNVQSVNNCYGFDNYASAWTLPTPDLATTGCY